MYNKHYFVGRKNQKVHNQKGSLLHHKLVSMKGGAISSMMANVSKDTEALWCSCLCFCGQRVLSLATTHCAMTTSLYIDDCNNYIIGMPLKNIL